MPGERGAGPRGAPRWERGLEVFANLVVVLFVGFVLLLPIFGGDADGDGHGQGRQRPPEGDGEMGHTTGGGGHAPPTLAGSFALIGIASMVAYVAALVVWARLRHTWAFLIRHVTSAAAMLLLVVFYLAGRGGLGYDQHNWNRSFADASVVLYAVTLAIGPLARLLRPASHALAWRRETAIWATVAAVMHVGVFWEESLGWSGWRRFFYPSEHGVEADSLVGDPGGGLAPGPFEVANVIGLVALGYAFVLTITSNDASQRWLKSGWSWLMRRSTTMWLLVLLHAWIFAYYVQPTLSFGLLWASFWTVLLLQTAAFAKRVWLLRRGSATAQTPSAAAP